MKLRLVIDVEYDANGVEEGALRDMLDYIPRHAAAEGLFTRDTEAEVDTWRHEIVKLA